jgi:uncharacterized protein YcnI
MKLRPARLGVRAAVAATLIAAVVLIGSEICWAHVTPQPPTLPKGASDVIIGFAVPNEMTDSSTVKLELDLPTDHPITGIHADAKPGWTAAVGTVKLAKPITTDDGQITEVVSRVTWTASGPGIQPNEYSDFTLLAGLLPSNVSSLTFKAVQTYSDGTVVSWIEPTVTGTPSPEHPAPVLKLTGKTKKH